MKRSLIGCLAGLLTWLVVVTVINRVLRLTLTDYSAAEHTLRFTLAMKWARLLMALATSLAAGAVTGWVSPSSRWEPLVVGSVVLAMFLPSHISLWSRFPVWYHLTFLLPIIPAVLVGALLPPLRKDTIATQPEGGQMAEQLTTLAHDPFRGRRPTSHERMTGRPWDASYSDGPAPWDIGQPQPAIVRLASKGVFSGSVLDAGCGLGENSLHIASLGLPVLGVDIAETALASARKKAADLGVDAEFATADAFHLEYLGRRFETVLDCGLFHTFESHEQPEYAASLASAMKQDGTLYILCFSDQGPDPGPHPIRQEELRAAFSPDKGWNLVAIESERIETRYHTNGVSAWLVTIKRTCATEIQSAQD